MPCTPRFVPLGTKHAGRIAAAQQNPGKALRTRAFQSAKTAGKPGHSREGTGGFRSVRGRPARIRQNPPTAPGQNPAMGRRGASRMPGGVREAWKGNGVLAAVWRGRGPTARPQPAHADLRRNGCRTREAGNRRGPQARTGLRACMARRRPGGHRGPNRRPGLRLRATPCGCSCPRAGPRACPGTPRCRGPSRVRGPKSSSRW